MCVQVSTPGSRVRFWGCSLAGLSRTARGLKRLSAMDTLYLMPDGWWEINYNTDGAAATLHLKWKKSVSPALQIQASLFFFNEGKLFSWCNVCCRLMDYRRLWHHSSAMWYLLNTDHMMNVWQIYARIQSLNSEQLPSHTDTFSWHEEQSVTAALVYSAWGHHHCVWIVNCKCVNGAVIYFTNGKTKEKGHHNSFLVPVSGYYDLLGFGATFVIITLYQLPPASF